MIIIIFFFCCSYCVVASGFCGGRSFSKKLKNFSFSIQYEILMASNRLFGQFFIVVHCLFNTCTWQRICQKYKQKDRRKLLIKHLKKILKKISLKRNKHFYVVVMLKTKGAINFKNLQFKM